MLLFKRRNYAICTKYFLRNLRIIRNKGKIIHSRETIEHELICFIAELLIIYPFYQAHLIYYAIQ